ncbi:VCBS [Beggiatoa sp. PS]|nr:VCBS [Beggiatoa sp. PS]
MDGEEVESSTTLPLEGGLHSIKVEYVAGTSITVDWSETSEIAGNNLSFDGMDDYVDLQTDVVELAQADFSLEAWINTAYSGSGQGILVSNDADSSWELGEKAFHVTSSGTLQFVGWGNGYIKGSTAVNDGQWHHVAVVWDYTAGSGKIYLDGADDTDTGGTNYVASNANNAGDTLKIAYSNFNSSEAPNYFNGGIDEVRVWNTARSQAEIQAYMKSTLKGTESNLVAYYQLDESSGTTATDTTGNYDGTLNGDPTWGVSDAPLTDLPAPGSALELDGSGDYITLPDDKTWFNGDLTIESWVYPHSYANWSRILDIGQGSGDYNVVLALTNETSGKPSFRVFDDNGNRNPLESNTALTISTWNHIAVTLSGTTATMYINGAESGSITNSYIPSDVTRDKAYIGHSNWSNDADANAVFDEMRIWDVARSQAEIQAYMNRTMDGNESGLIAYYNFDEKAASSIAVLSDIAGNNLGTLNGNPTWVDSDAPVSKMIAPGNAMSFDGVDDYVAFDDTIPLDDTYTIEGWFQTSNTGDILSFTDSGNHYALIELAGNGIMRFLHRVPAGSANGTNIYSSAGYADGSWHHFACVKDETGMYIYMDGEQVASGSDSNAIGDSVEVVIGRLSPTNSSRYFEGSLDEIRIWNTARTQTEIQADMYRALGSFETGLVAYYKFDQDSGTEVVDITSFDNDGTLNGGPSWVTSEVPMD